MREKANTGDYILITEKHSSFNSDGKMDRYIGTVMTVTRRSLNGVGVKCKEDHGNWYWNDKCYRIVTELLTTDEGLLNLTTKDLMEKFNAEDGE